MGAVALALLCVLQSPAADSPTTSNPAELADLSLEELINVKIATVYTASKFEQKSTEAPSSVTVITSEDIKQQGWRTLAELLQSVQGFQVSYDRNYAFLGTRGFNLGDFNSRILLLVNGHRINNNRTDGAYIDTGFVLDMDLVDRVEIIRGPGSVLYGNNAFFGVINVITRQGAQMTGNGVEASGEYGEFNSYKARVTYGRLFTNGLQMLVSGTYYDSDGAPHLFYKEFYNPPGTNGVADHLDRDHCVSAFGSLSYRDFSLEGGYNRREKVNPTAQFVGPLGGFGMSGLASIDERRFAAFKYAHAFPDIFDVTARVYYDVSDFDIGYPTSTGTYREEDTGEWWGGEAQLTARLQERYIFTLGVEYRDDFRQHQKNLDPAGAITSETSRSRQSHGVYFQGNVAVLTNLQVNGGVRYDQYGDFDPAYSPRVALIYSPFTTSTLKAIYGTAFRTPNFLELVLSSGLQPESITSYELVYEQQFGNHLRSSLSGFYNEMDDLIIFQNGSFNNYDAITRGTELALQGFWPKGVRSRASYTFQHTTRADGLNQPDSPEHLVKLDLSVPVFRDNIFASLEFQYTSCRHTVYTTSGGITLPGADTGDFSIVNFTLFSQNLVKNLELSASIYNLLDTHYSDPSTRFHEQDMIERDGRTYRLKLTYRF